MHRCINFTQTYPKITTYPKSIFKKKTLSKLKFSSTSATTSLIITTQSHNQFSQILWFFDGVYFFLWPAFLSIYLLQADNWEESLIIFSDVLKTTLAICHIVGKPYNWLNLIWSKTRKALDEISLPSIQFYTCRVLLEYITAVSAIAW